MFGFFYLLEMYALQYLFSTHTLYVADLGTIQKLASFQYIFECKFEFFGVTEFILNDRKFTELEFLISRLTFF